MMPGPGCLLASVLPVYTCSFADPRATLDDLPGGRDDRRTRNGLRARVLGGAHPFTKNIEGTAKGAKAAWERI